MDIKEMIFGTVGGLGLFLFGMSLMSEGLKKAAGQRLKNILESMTKRAPVAFLVGAGVTALVQSSSATTVMVVGFVNAGLLTLKQAIAVVIGTNVGTTATAWLVSISGIGALKISAYALPLVGVGFLMGALGKTRRAKNIGQIMLGFGILFLGVDFMKGAFADIRGSTQVQDLFQTLATYPVLAILAGAVMTMLLQSSSAAIAIVQAMAMGGAFGGDWQRAVGVVVPFVIGSNIGTTITAQLAALQANLNSRRTAWAHTMFNLIGAVLALPFVYMGMFAGLVRWIAPWSGSADNLVWDIALAHLFFNLVNSLIFLPLTGVLERIVVRLVPGRKSDLAVRPVILENHLLDTPSIALAQAKREIIRMAKTAKRALRRSVDGMLSDNRRSLQIARETEDFVDTFQLEITSYLTALSARQLDDEVSIELPVLLHTVNDLERIADHAVNIVEIADRKIEQKLSFSESALGESERLRSEVGKMFANVIIALDKGDAAAASRVLASEAKLNAMQVEFRRTHVQRMTDGQCTPQTGLIFIDLVDNIEKIGDHLTNIAQAIIGGLQWEGIKPKTAGTK